MNILVALGMAAAALLVLRAWTGLPFQAEFGDGVRSRIALGLLLGALALTVFLPVAAFEPGREIDTGELSLHALFAGHYVLMIFLVAWWLLRPRRPSPAEFLRFAGGDWGTRIGQGVRAGVVGWIATITATLTLGGLVGASGSADPAGGVPDIVTWVTYLPVVSKLLIIAMAMTVEEAFFRGFLQPRFGILATSLFFACGHFSYGLPFLVVGVFVISFVLGRTFERTGDLLPCIVAHGVFDGIQMLIVLPLAVRSLPT